MAKIMRSSQSYLRLPTLSRSQARFWAKICKRLSEEQLRAWCEVHNDVLHPFGERPKAFRLRFRRPAFQHKFRAYCRICRQSLERDEIDAHAQITGQTREQAEAWFDQHGARFEMFEEWRRERKAGRERKT